MITITGPLLGFTFTLTSKNYHHHTTKHYIFILTKEENMMFLLKDDLLFQQQGGGGTGGDQRRKGWNQGEDNTGMGETSDKEDTPEGGTDQGGM
jgi:hypothetical protein